MSRPPVIMSIDFDGVLHSYATPWRGATLIPDPPVAGAFDFLSSLQSAGWTVAIFSRRNYAAGGIEAMKDWLYTWAVHLHYPRSLIDAIVFPLEKPNAMVFLDDRALRFEGTFPTVHELRLLRPWNRPQVIPSPNPNP